jgi:hypothetical protein
MAWEEGPKGTRKTNNVSVCDANALKSLVLVQEVQVQVLSE